MWLFYVSNTCHTKIDSNYDKQWYKKLLSLHRQRKAETNPIKSTLRWFFRQSIACNFVLQNMWHSCRGEGRENARKKNHKMRVREAPACTVKMCFYVNCPFWENLSRICSLQHIIFTIDENISVKYNLVFRLKYLKCVLILHP